MNIDENMYIEKWDTQHCAAHVEHHIHHISNSINTYYKNKSIIFIDIGANVGKFYDLIKKKSIVDIKKAYLFEPSNRLYEYILKKYSNDSIVKVYNEIILDQETLVNFDDTYITDEINSNNNYINFGLSKINLHKYDNMRKTIKISDFIINNNLHQENLFIKIDTENSDFFILQDILSIMDKLSYKPAIEFEINYTASIMTADNAQLVLDNYHNLYNYNTIDLKNTIGDGFLIPE